MDVKSRRPIMRAIPITVVLSVVAAALLLIAFAYWRRGTFALGVSMVLAAAFRVVLSERTIGVLAVRGKAFDLLFYSTTAALMLALAIGVP
jgi:hypothetical protein